MSMADRGWRDSTENYADSYVLNVTGTTATALMGQDYKQPVALVGISITLNTSVGSGDVVLRDGSATGDADSQAWRLVVASGNNGPFHATTMFARPLAFNSGIVVSATTVTGSISLLYKARY